MVRLGQDSMPCNDVEDRMVKILSLLRAVLGLVQT